MRRTLLALILANPFATGAAAQNANSFLPSDIAAAQDRTTTASTMTHPSADLAIETLSSASIASQLWTRRAPPAAFGVSRPSAAPAFSAAMLAAQQGLGQDVSSIRVTQELPRVTMR